jgi:hypothetical protein
VTRDARRCLTLYAWEILREVDTDYDDARDRYALTAVPAVPA